MTTLSKVLREPAPGTLLFWCPGCNHPHQIQYGSGRGPRWAWNGDAERPVFGPSVLARSGHYVPGHEAGKSCWCAYYSEHPDEERDFECSVCHSFVGCNGAQPGEIIFLGDSTHALAGQTVPLAEFPEGWGS